MDGEGTQLLFGRDFTEAELALVREVVALFPRLSSKELAATLCEHLGWATSAGRLKVESCLKLLLKLEAKGEIKLLPKARKAKRKESAPLLSKRTDPPSQELAGELWEFEPVWVLVQDKEGMWLWNEYIQRYHPLGYQRPFGAHQRYFIVCGGGELLGCISFAASAWAVEARDRWIGWSQSDRSRRLHLVANNNRFLIFPWVKVKNLASRVLALVVRRIREDWQARYGYGPVLLETFVDLEYACTCYRAANWIKLGQTAGRGRMDRDTQYLSTPKRIYVYPLVREFRAVLCGKEKGGSG
ncbi:MAG: DUF4338 domain-containing protein [Clostridia bacterium]|nr:MAG: DUF4338 domain-containing protein [Clostridia bacterium]